MKTAIAMILIIILLATIAQIFLMLQEKNQLREKFNTLNAKAQVLNKDNEKTKLEIEYFSRPENLEKELKSKFNYKKPGEKMIIITP